ncbi:MAG: 50S ribosomal protein L11 methyltransferase [Chloroflexi bacterium]|nr:50S ribosomal protein L11 methyltransferase [Chloroflexota bacterium]
MAWQELSIKVPYEYVEPISYLFGRYGRGLSLEQDGSDKVLLRTYLPVSSRQRLARIDVGLRLVSILEPLDELTITALPEEDDWQKQWQAHFDLLRVGQHLVIKPSWIDYEATTGEVVVELDPGMAFGTGYHPTTYTCLEAIEDILEPGMAVLDLGTGSGILTIAAVKLGAGSVVALDIDSQAVRAARQNFRRTRVQRKVTLSQGSIPHALAGEGSFDLVVANISARAVRERAPFILPCLAPQGRFVASGILKTQQEEVDDTLIGLGCSLERQWPQEEWVTLVYRPAPA